jgi:hypothetical protein
MDKSESQIYRDQLASEIKSSPRELRKSILEQAKNSDGYLNAFLEHNSPRWEKRREAETRRTKERKPQIEFNLDDLDDLRQKLTIAAEFIYSTITAYDKEGGYNPHKGHMLCGEITDRFISYLQSRGVQSKRVDRAYLVRGPDGSYDDNFGHVYLSIDREEDHTLVDFTYLQWVAEEIRKELPPGLVIRYKDKEDLRRQFSNIPITNKLVLPFYLGFDSEEAREFFKDSKYTVESDEVARIDD